jgi:hypothetical protein
MQNLASFTKPLLRKSGRLDRFSLIPSAGFVRFRIKRRERPWPGEPALAIRGHRDNRS